MADQHPLAADVWVFSPGFESVLVVEHRWRGLVPPGGRVEEGETPREAASRELREETGLDLDLGERPAFAALRSYRSDWPVTLGLSYWAIAETEAALRPEPGQPARWVLIDDHWRTFHPDDARVMRRFVAELCARKETAR
ncbi:DNA mismatch repair protein MutT [Mycetocola zhujimingii]|uniref:DNA mismatch repair protein MutT n=2 Tax=Mycetocola zhujimingii TaxID=2079792 RepID=A0A2U1TFA9_9MICO|nr:DNA mismatch repair protein MutT [Mycetocola zhujimingii]